MNLLESGSVTYLLGGRKVRIDAGCLSLFWAAIPHQILSYSRDTRYFVATIPFAWFLQFKLPDTVLQPLLRGEVLSEADGRHLRIDRDLFGRWEADLRDPTEEVRRIVLLEMEARILRLAAALSGAGRPDRDLRRPRAALPESGLNKVEQMACLIARRYTERLTVKDIARAVGLHPNYSMNLFKEAFGTTLIEYLTHHRISHAQRLLATTDMKILDVALSSGFNSVSRFNEAFRRACGQPPRQYRRNHVIFK